MGRLSIVVDNDNFVIEQGNTSNSNDNVGEVSPYKSYRPENHAIQWYRQFFFGKDHINYLARDSPLGPVAISVTQDGSDILAIIRKSEGIERRRIPLAEVKLPWWQKLFSSCLGGNEPELAKYVAGLLRKLDISIPMNDLHFIDDDNLKKELVEMEDIDSDFFKKFKLGVVYCKKGQGKRETEDDMFCNTEDDTIPEFNEFLKALGDKIELKGWTGYAGGLDVKEDRYGSHSVFSKWNSCDVMYHVSTLLPQSKTNKQQIQKKKHIGNDTCCIVFQEPGSRYDPDTITTNVVRCYVIVSPVGGGKFRLAVAYRDGVPEVEPSVPDQPIFAADSSLRDFILTKLINHQIAVYESPSFAEKLNSYRNGKLRDLAKKYVESDDE
eukprot:TRINITY_DN266_c0_g1::TRINITY_DN266_c0_g1_i1::g.1656::m.1656 TRINITY_DN266_c0_g1::TRINITY_DN266_c0_g1_i1::g.1656  ORF type:complete len:381 (+),score=56.01,sp/Q5VVW2/GARL3_HUMAN/34.69/8e-50,Rap_GAP/PF02145.10/1.9e-52,PPDFL/PF15060.1/0.13 TRINITY_DN266_c0_g1_i1:40-1182(+)